MSGKSILCKSKILHTRGYQSHSLTLADDDVMITYLVGILQVQV